MGIEPDGEIPMGCWNTARTSMTASMSSSGACTCGREMRESFQESHITGGALSPPQPDHPIPRRQNAEAAIRFDDVAEVDGLGIREADDRRGMKALPDDESRCEMPVCVFTGEDRRSVVRRRSAV